VTPPAESDRAAESRSAPNQAEDRRHDGAQATNEPVPEEKRVSWAELFFDLVFVFAVTEVSTLLRGDHAPAGVGRAAIIFVPIYWVWVGTSIRANTHDITSRRQLSLFTIALAGLVMALAVPDAYHGRALLFAAGYWAARLVLGSRLFTGTRSTFSVFVVSMVITGPLLVIGAFVHGSGQVALWALAAAVDLATPRLLRTHVRQRLRVNGAHLAERYGSFVLIALGESVVTIGAPVAGDQPLRAGSLVAVAVSFAVCCGLWWVYFQHTAETVRRALDTAADQTDIIRTVLSYGHLLLIAGIIAMAVGLHEVVTAPGARLGWEVAGLLFAGCALYLATFGYTRRRMRQQVSPPDWSPPPSCCCSCPPHDSCPPWLS